MAVADGMELAVARLAWSSAAPGASPGVRLRGRFNLTLSGAVTGVSATLQRSFDNGATWHDCTRAGAPVVLSGPLSEVCDEPEAGVLYRVNLSAIASGTLAARLSQ
jgi:hypothetical protein